MYGILNNIDEFSILLRYSRSLKFTERPDYDWLKNLFKELFNNSNFSINTAFDWIPLLTKQSTAPQQANQITVIGVRGAS